MAERPIIFGEGRMTREQALEAIREAARELVVDAVVHRDDRGVVRSRREPFIKLLDALAAYDRAQGASHGDEHG